MQENKQKSWCCTVCGYIHQGETPPDLCPICGTEKRDFEPYNTPETSIKTSAEEKPDKWQCLNCNYVHYDADPPDICLVCGANKDKFEPARKSVSAAGAKKTNVVIVGGGVAGISAAESVRNSSPDSEITVISSETEIPYYRLNLTRYLGGEITRDTLPIHNPEWYRQNKIKILLNLLAEKVLKYDKKIVLSDGSSLNYEKIIITTGSHSYVPNLPGISLANVFSLRTVEDADEILAEAKKGAKIVGIGGGILGLEIAGALGKQGADITLLESHDWLMPRQLNKKAGEIFETYVKGIGVKIIKNARTKELLGNKNINAVLLQDGRAIPADMVVIATGVRPNTAIARKSEIEVNNGIVVDNHLRTSQDNIYAAGDVAEHNGILYGSWAASQFQGGIAGLNAVGIETQFGGLPRSNTIKALGLDLTSIGKFQPDDGSYVVFEDEGANSYVEFVFRDGKMVGAILLGHPELSAPSKRAIESKTDFTTILKLATNCSEIIENLK